MNIYVFDVDKLSRRVLDRTWPNLGAKKAENDPKLAPQNDPKSIQKSMPKIDRNFDRFLIDFWTPQEGGTKSQSAGRRQRRGPAKDFTEGKSERNRFIDAEKV